MVAAIQKQARIKVEQDLQKCQEQNQLEPADKVKQQCWGIRREGYKVIILYPDDPNDLNKHSL